MGSLGEDGCIGKTTRDGKEYTIVSLPTRGDGEFNRLSVDSGMIAIMSPELVIDKRKDLGKLVDMEYDFPVGYTSGHLFFGHITISLEEEEEEEE